MWSSIESFRPLAAKAQLWSNTGLLAAQLNEIKREKAELIRNNQVLHHQNSITLSYDIQLSDIFAPLTISSAKPTRRLQTRLPQLVIANLLHKKTREANPNVKYWMRQEWATATSDRVADFEEGGQSGARGRTRAAQGINVNMRYIEDRNGQPINGHLASDIRRHARAIFVGFALQGRLFTSWTEADHTSLKTY